METDAGGPGDTSSEGRSGAVRRLLEAVAGIGGGLDLDAALARIVQAAVTLVDVRYGALEVTAGEQRTARFVTVGVSEEQVAAIGPHPEEHGLTGIPVRAGGEVCGNLYLAERSDGTPFGAEDEAVLAALAAAAGVAIDNARLHEEARRRRQWLETLSELTRGLLAGEDVDDGLAAFVQRVRRFAAADLAVIALWEAGAESAGESGSADGGDSADDSDGAEDSNGVGHSLLIVAADGVGAGRLRGVAVGVEDTLLGAVFKSGRLWLFGDGDVDGDAELDDDSRTGRDLLPGVECGPSLVAPLGTGGRVRGVLVLNRRPGGAPYDAGITDLTADLAVQVAVALELAARREDGELLSLYADRDRIGRDLHDLAIQRLFATSMSLQGAFKLAETPALVGRISQAIADLDDTIKAIRSTIFALQARERGGDAPGGWGPEAGEHGLAAAALDSPPATMAAGPPRLSGLTPRRNHTGAPSGAAVRSPHGRG
jgi:signal transduction histidine kinase